MVRGAARRILFNFLIGFVGVLASHAQPFSLPTANRAVLDPVDGTKAFAPTPGRDWHSGTFGCVRSEGHQFHEGIDILSVARDRKGEPADPVMAAADGTVAYVNRKSGLSNYGNYLVIEHVIEGLPVYTLYAHLKEVGAGISPGSKVKTGEQVAVLGRTSNTRQAITRDRAHVHFELNLFLSDRFDAWHTKFMAGTRNDHGMWNGQNMAGVDPWQLFLAQGKEGARFSLRHFIQSQPELCRVVVREKDFSFARRYAALIDRNAKAEKEGVAGYEIALTCHGAPIRLIPRAESELKSKARVSVLGVNPPVFGSCPCGKLVTKSGSSWALTSKGERLVGLLTF